MEALDLTVNPKAELDVYPAVIQEGEMVTLDARESDAVEGVLTEYIWDFGDGDGHDRHRLYLAPVHGLRHLHGLGHGGQRPRRRGRILVAGDRQRSPEHRPRRAGVDPFRRHRLARCERFNGPEGAPLSFVWDLNLAVDSDGNGQPEDDADAITPDVLVPTDTSGLIRGRLTVEDTDGGVVTEDFELNVTARRFPDLG